MGERFFVKPSDSLRTEQLKNNDVEAAISYFDKVYPRFFVFSPKHGTHYLDVQVPTS